MKAKLITYELTNLNQYDKVLVNRALFGFKDNSNKCNYQYQREGILSKIPYYKLLRGAIIVYDKDKSKILPVLKKYKVRYNLLDIVPKSNMLH